MTNNFEFTYKCENCGECCRNWNVARFDKSMTDNKGNCIYLDLNTNLCTIYDNRPDFCNIKVWYNKHFSHISYEQFIHNQKIGCDALIKIGQKRRKYNEEKEKSNSN